MTSWRAHEGEAWHGPSLRELLQDVTAEQAEARPVAGAHSIRELVCISPPGRRSRPTARRRRGADLQHPVRLARRRFLRRRLARGAEEVTGREREAARGHTCDSTTRNSTSPFRGGCPPSTSQLQGVVQNTLYPRGPDRRPQDGAPPAGDDKQHATPTKKLLVTLTSEASKQHHLQPPRTAQPHRLRDVPRTLRSRQRVGRGREPVLVSPARATPSARLDLSAINTPDIQSLDVADAVRELINTPILRCARLRNPSSRESNARPSHRASATSSPPTSASRRSRPPSVRASSHRPHPDGGSTHFLPRLVGYARAFELMASGATLSAQEAHPSAPQPRRPARRTRRDRGRTAASSPPSPQPSLAASNPPSPANQEGLAAAPRTRSRRSGRLLPLPRLPRRRHRLHAEAPAEVRELGGE